MISPPIILSVVTRMSVMPCRMNCDVHEWFNEVVTVPGRHLLKILSGAQTGDAQWEAKTLWNFTATCRCNLMEDAQHRQERRCRHFGGDGATL